MKPTQGMMDAAQQGLDYRREYGRGGTEVGIARARDIVNGRNLSPETVRRMNAFFDRHEQNRNSADKEPDGGPTNGWIAWLLWGGDPGRTWAEWWVRRMETASAELTDFGPINLAEDDTIERQIFRWGPVEHPAGDFVVNQEFARAMLESFAAMAEQGYFPPVLFEHSSAGTIKGLVRGLRVTSEGINAILELAAGVKELADRGELHYLSPSFYAEFKSPTDGRLLRFALREVSFVSVPHLKNLRVESLHYALQEANIMPEEMDMMAVREAVDAALAAMEARVVALETAVAKLADPSEAEAVEEEVVEEAGEHYGDKEKAMSERVAKLEADNRRLLRQLAEREIMTELGDVDGSTMKNLVELREANQRLYRTVVDTMKAAQPAKMDLSERGVVGQTPTGPVTYDRAVEMGEAKGIKRGTLAMVEYLASKHPHLMA
jgi:hypothetical protein